MAEKQDRRVRLRDRALAEEPRRLKNPRRLFTARVRREPGVMRLELVARHGHVSGARPIRIMLVTDRANRHRGEHWGDVLEGVKARGIVNPTLTRWPLGDKLAGPLAPGNREFFERLREADVLIVNWDAVNGDPEFGADVARGWFATRWLALRDWLNRGGMLIIEGQTLLGVPDAGAYAAVLGPGEVRLSGPADVRRPEAQTTHMMGGCRVTRIGRSAPGFEGLDFIDPWSGLTYNHLFPPETAGRLIAPYVRQVNWASVLYRGWFQRRRGNRATLQWIPFARRAKMWPQNHPTLLVAKCGGRGIVYATTMLLAATRQTVLIEAMLQSHGRIAEFPEPSTLRKAMTKYIPRVAAPFLASLLVLSLAQPEMLGQVVPVTVSDAEPFEKLMWSTIFALMFTILLDLVPIAWRLGRRIVRAFSGA